MKEKIINLILENDQKHIGERGTVYYAETMADKLMELFKNIYPDCELSPVGRDE